MSQIPLLVKISYTAYVGILVPVYWRYYGPANFLWFSDLGLLFGLVGIWLESPLLCSMQAVSIVLLESLWTVDFLARLIGGVQPIGLTKYMFNRDIPLGVRALSTFHLWLPPLLVWAVYRVGYDDRAWLAQSALAWVVILVCYWCFDAKRNINWVYGPGGRPQHALPRTAYLLLVMLVFPLSIYLPSHLIFLAIMPARP